MATKDKADQSNDPGREGSNNSAKSQKGNVGQQPGLIADKSKAAGNKSKK